MATLQVTLFGKFCVQRGEQPLVGLDGHKAQELFAYLLLYRDHPYPRETLAELLWNENPSTQSKKHLRQVLWQLQHVFQLQAKRLTCPVLLVEPGWIQLNPAVDLWLDVAELEEAFIPVRGLSGYELDSYNVRALRQAVQLYQGELLEGWYHDWCLPERERLHNIYLSILQKLMESCEAKGQYEIGLGYGTQILCHDPTRESFHRRLMRLHYLAGNRNLALYQYEQCAATLAEELQIEPAKKTVTLYNQIKADRLTRLPSSEIEAPPTTERQHLTLPALLKHLKQIQANLADIQHQVERDLEIIERTLDKQS